MIVPPPAVLEALKARYGEPQRHYHTWAHVEALLSLFETHQGLVRDPTRVLWAIYWHDAIYDPRANDNEARSAALLRVDAADTLPADKIAQIQTMIMATAKHEQPAGMGFDLAADCAVFLDFDLSILAAPQAEFDRYEEDIRKEYEFVSDETFAQVRCGILKRFLERPKLYFSPLLSRAWEQPARANLARSIAKLARAQTDGG